MNNGAEMKKEIATNCILNDFNELEIDIINIYRQMKGKLNPFYRAKNEGAVTKRSAASLSRRFTRENCIEP